MARIHSEAQEWDLAIEYYKKAIKESPEGVEALKELTMIFFLEKRDAQTACSYVEKLNNILSEDPNVQSFSLICDSISSKLVEIKLSNPNDLKNIGSSKFRKPSMRASEKWQLLSRAYDFYEKDNFHEALQIIDRVVEMDLEYISPLILKAKIFLKLKKMSELDNLLNEIEGKSDKIVFPYSWIELALIYDEMGNVQQAFNYLKKSAQGFFKSQTVVVLIDFCEKHGSWKEAEDLLNDIILTCQECPNSLWMASFMAAKEGKIKKAAKLLHYVSMIDSEDYLLYFWLGHYYIQLNELNRVIENYEKGLTLHHGDIHVYYNLGYAYYESNDYARSAINYEKAILLRPHFAEAHLNLGMAYTGLKQWKKAEVALKKALTLNPSLYQAYYYLWKIAKETGDQAAARKYHFKYLEKSKH